MARSIRALGTRVTVLVRSPDVRRTERAIHRALREVAAIHQDFTLFEPSPLVTFNHEARRQRVEVPTWLHGALSQASALQRVSSGTFDPWLGTLTSTTAPPPRVRGKVELDADGRSLRLRGEGVALDLNGLAKGLAVDRCARVLRDHGFCHFVVNAGGDLLAAGDDGSGEPGWPVHLAQGLVRSGLTLRLRDQAVATSGNLSRGAAGSTPHLIDPRTGLRTDPLRTATVKTTCAALADGWATALFVAGPEHAAALVRKHAELSAWVVTHDGQVSALGHA
ncbi:MAG: FAD:protein FMN transferase [Pseudomonadota bacterium]